MGMYPKAIRRYAAIVAVLVLSACKVEMHTGLDERSANEMLAALLSSGVSAEKQPDKDGVSILVAEAQFSEAVELLASRGLPRSKYTNVGEVFNAEGIVASPMQEWAKLNYAKSQELSNSINSIPGVVRVSVNIAETRNDGPFDEKQPPTASLVVQMEKDLITEDIVPQLKQLVAFSIPNIKYENVGVIVAPISVRQVDQKLVSLSGILVHRDSALAVRVLGGVASVTSIAALSFGVLFFFTWRSRRVERTSKANGMSA